MYKHAIAPLDYCSLLFVTKVDVGLKVNLDCCFVFISNMFFVITNTVSDR